MKVTTVNIYNVLSKILTACFETQKGEEFKLGRGGGHMKDVMYLWRAVFEANVLDVHSRILSSCFRAS